MLAVPIPIISLQPPPPVQSTARTTVEDVEDEDDVAVTPSKKKKKKKKKPKKERGIDAAEEGPSQTMVSTSQSQDVQTLSPSTGEVDVGADAGCAPAASLPIEPSTTTAATARATSGHAYLQQIGAQKEKIKSRPDHASLFSEKRGFFSKLGGKVSEKDREEEMEKAKDREKTKSKGKATGEGMSKTSTWFSNLGKKTAGYMQQLLGSRDEKQGGLRWEHFLKVQCGMSQCQFEWLNLCFMACLLLFQCCLLLIFALPLLCR